MTQQEIRHFFDRQLGLWHDCAKRYADLAEASTKTLTLEGREYKLMFNPARIRSAAAKVTAGKVERPCFLCRNNRPAEQIDIRISPDNSDFSYLLSVNPFPILPNHFTIISDAHCRQTINESRLRDMAYMARLMEGYLVFFNGACSGASAPDHFHFQAVPANAVPLTQWNEDVQNGLGVQLGETDNVKIDYSQSDNCNILCWNSPEGLRWWVVNRRCHRPWQYDAEEDEKVLISPAALEFAGIVPLARKEDFDKMDASLLCDIYLQCWNREPFVEVGIGTNLEATANDDGTHSVDGVRIGIGFHWDQKRRFRYEGQMLHRIDPTTGERWLVNRLPVENYLKSVISSEMSATSSLQLLKAHAVISRSWLLRQIKPHARRNGETETLATYHCIESDGEIIRWYDSDAHGLFDVCADDHCQRYQGISEKLNAVVEQAIDETRGEVLMYGDEICDARFSKCCGGISEEYKYCWDNKNVPYLKAIRDCRPDGSAFCDTNESNILQQVLNDYDQTTRDFFRWTAEYSQKELSELVERKLGLHLGEIQALEPVERGAGGRISRLRIIGSEKTIVVGKELEIRRALSETHLYSSKFDVEKTVNTQGETVFRLSGVGWGHGVGLCQIGAAVMGAEGYDYKEILRHYYKDAEIKKIW